MKRRPHILILMLAVTLSMGAGAGAEQGAGGEGDVQALRAEISQLRNRLNEIEGRTWLDERRAEEVKSLVREVLNDAETRASLLESGMYAGHDGQNFFLKSADGGFLMNIAGQVQLRYTHNSRDGQRDSANSPTSGSDDGEGGFELRRTKLKFSGHIADPKIIYSVQLRVSEATNTVAADEIVLAYQLTDSVLIWGGEGKAPVLREEMIDSRNQLAVDRSYANEIFTGGIVQGVGLVWHDPSVLDDRLKVNFAVTDGARSAESPAGTIPLTQPTRSVTKRFHEDASNVALTLRGDYRLRGDWAKFGEFTSWPGEDTTILIGAAVHHEFGETGDAVDGNNDFTLWTVDASYQANGLSAYAAFMMLHTDNEASFGDYDPWGLVLQAAYNIPLGDDSIEPFVRYDHVDLDGFATALSLTDDDIDMITLGVNYYLTKHNAKLTLDVVWALDSVPLASSNIGVLADAGSEDDQVLLRAQFQLLF